MLYSRAHAHTHFCSCGEYIHENATDVRNACAPWDVRSGLSSLEAAGRLRKDGPNELDPPQEEPFLRILLRQADLAGDTAENTA